MDEFLLSRLACPCPRHESVTIAPDSSGLTCDFCATTFPVVGDIPVMLLSEATPGPAGVGRRPETGQR